MSDLDELRIGRHTTSITPNYTDTPSLRIGGTEVITGGRSVKRIRAIVPYPKWRPILESDDTWSLGRLWGLESSDANLALNKPTTPSRPNVVDGDLDTYEYGSVDTSTWQEFVRIDLGDVYDVSIHYKFCLVEYNEGREMAWRLLILSLIHI